MIICLYSMSIFMFMSMIMCLFACMSTLVFMSMSMSACMFACMLRQMFMSTLMSVFMPVSKATFMTVFNAYVFELFCMYATISDYVCNFVYAYVDVSIFMFIFSCMFVPRVYVIVSMFISMSTVGSM